MCTKTFWVPRLAPAVAVTKEDEEALSVVRGVFQIVEDVGITMQALSDSQTTSRAVQELTPLAPELLPGQRTL